MSFSGHVRAKNEKQYTARPAPLKVLTENLLKAKTYCQDHRQDWVVFVTGIEGSGKSTLAAHVAKIFDPDFRIEESMIYDFRDSEFSYLKFMLKYQDTPYKVAWYDEAVTVLFSQEHNSKDSALAQKIFKIKRDCRHFDILVSPSFWDIVPDIRERRVKSLLYCYVVVSHPATGRTEYKHYVAYFSGDKIVKLSQNRKAKTAFRSHKSLFKLVRPDFVEEFPEMPHDIESLYMKSKRDHRMEILDAAAGLDDPTEGTNKLLQPENGKLNFSDLKEELESMVEG